jgi:hypothetical protein
MERMRWDRHALIGLDGLALLATWSKTFEMLMEITKRRESIKQQLGNIIERFEKLQALEQSPRNAADESFIPQSLTDASSMRCQVLNKDLPINIKGKKLDASPDTGSDECCMPKDVADKLGLKVRCDPGDIKSFEKGDGRILKSIGRTTIDCSFWKEPGRKIRCVFYVFEKLITPLIMGRKFLESTETLTRHQNRLVDRPPRAGVYRVMHLSRPKRRMRCYIDSDLVNANPDTGAEMELVSPEFIKRKGYTVTAPDTEHEEVQFVDGSTARTQGQVTMRFEAYGDALQEAIPTKARYRKFYVIDGLTTDVLLGEDLLYGINAFTDHASSFVDVDEFGLPLELKGIVWLDRAEQRLARVFGGDILDMSAQASPGSAGKRLTSKWLCPTSSDRPDDSLTNICKSNRLRTTIANAAFHLANRQSNWCQNSGRGPPRRS